MTGGYKVGAKRLAQKGRKPDRNGLHRGAAASKKKTWRFSSSRSNPPLIHLERGVFGGAAAADPAIVHEHVDLVGAPERGRSRAQPEELRRRARQVEGQHLSNRSEAARLQGGKGYFEARFGKKRVPSSPWPPRPSREATSLRRLGLRPRPPTRTRRPRRAVRARGARRGRAWRRRAQTRGRARGQYPKTRPSPTPLCL